MSTYKLTSEKIAGHILLTYKDDNLVQIAIETATPLNLNQYRFLMESMLFNEWTLRKVGIHENFTMVPVIPTVPLQANEKIALFCRMYKQFYNGLAYKAYSKDGAMIKNFDISEPLLETYFKSTNFLFKNKHSIRNLITYYNEVRAEHASFGKAKYPNYYCKELLEVLTPKEKYEYKEHLAKHNIHLSLT